MSSGEVRKVSREDIQLVQNLIECCLQLYMNQKEVVDTLSFQAKIEPSFTELVWQKLEEENREFFKAYNVRLMLKNQIMVFNKLLERQVELMQKPGPTSIDPTSVSNGSMSAPWNAPASASPLPNDLLCNGVSSSSLANGQSLRQDGSHVVSGSSVLTGSTERSNSILSAQNSSIGGATEIDGASIKTEPVYSSNAGFPFYSNNSFFEARQPVGDASTGSFRSSDFSSQSMQDPLLDMDNSFGFNQIPRNFSFSDLTDDFTHCSDILENYGRSPFLPHEASNFQDSPGKEFTDEESRRLDTISEGVSYDDFGSD